MLPVELSIYHTSLDSYVFQWSAFRWLLFYQGAPYWPYSSPSRALQVDFYLVECKAALVGIHLIYSMMKIVKSPRREPPNDPKKPPVKPPAEKRPPMKEPPDKKCPVGDLPPKGRIKAKAALFLQE
jgi:hypothetical protein